jgi:predicted Zn-dependent protease
MSMRARFEELARAIETGCAPGEFACATLEAERSEFVRINGARLRQAGRVERAVARIRLVQGDRQAIHQLTLPGLEEGRGELWRSVHDALAALRHVLADSAPDPLLDVNRDPAHSDDRQTHDDESAFDRAVFMKTVADAAGPADLVGFCAAGPLARGFCSSSGSRQWYQRERVSFDWSIHLPSDAAGGGDRKAVKASWSGPTFNATEVSQAIADSRRDAQVMARPVMRLAPGDYRALLSPRAFADLLEMLSWGGFSARAHQAGQSPLAWLRSGKSTLSPMRRIWWVMVAPLVAFQSQTWSRKALRPRSCRERPFSCNCRSTTICVAMPAWSVPGNHSVLWPRMR